MVYKFPSEELTCDGVNYTEQEVRKYIESVKRRGFNNMLNSYPLTGGTNAEDIELAAQKKVQETQDRLQALREFKMPPTGERKSVRSMMAESNGVESKGEQSRNSK